MSVTPFHENEFEIAVLYFKRTYSCIYFVHYMQTRKSMLEQEYLLSVPISRYSASSSCCAMQGAGLTSPYLHGQSHSTKIHWHTSQIISWLKMTQK